MYRSGINTMTANINTCSFFRSRKIGDYSYSRGGGTELISDTVTVAVVSITFYSHSRGSATERP